MRVVSVDPGLEGGLAVVDFEKLSFEWRPMPLLEVTLARQAVRRWIDVTHVGDFIDYARPEAIVIEQQSPMPRQSVSSTFTLGANYGMLRGVALDYCYTRPYVRLINAVPAVWKTELGVPVDKLEATRMCREIFGASAPDRDGPAEALLIAYWYWMRKQTHDADRAEHGILVEPRTLRTRTLFLTGHDAGRSGLFDGKYTPSRDRSPGRLFAGGDSPDGGEDEPRRRVPRKAGGRAGVRDPALP